ncbi:MAG: undecaprenyl/decaprenyl-phosphate alpha-N-acetylglucosaminyl 1-phosphate transferase [Thermoanaerobacteraceae bacterium]|nr:undecaprenyl/decaprenyl-phosphate alpha-N-acetylglucosaminyl 1-phosphate transferase [Thermoanaerobacteraceae bacterium]
MQLTKLLPGLFLAFAVTFGITPQLKKLAKRVGAVDIPDNRKVHRRVMPRIGGLGIYLGFVAALLVMFPLTAELKGLLVGGSIILVFGLVDDIRGISPKVKLAGQVIAALVAVHAGIRVDFITNPFGDIITLGRLAVPVTVFWIVGVTNAINLIDGLDGLAAGTSAIAAVTMAVVAVMEGHLAVAVMAAALAVSILGFLKYNFHPAQIFMGDSGSLFLGFTLAVLAIMGLTKSATIISVFIPVIILGIPIFDTFFAVVRRYLQGKPIFQADKGHLHHRLLHMGLSHKQTVLAIYGVNCTLGASAVLLTVLTTEQSLWILLGIAVLGIIGANAIGVTGIKAVRSRRLQQDNTKKYYHN